jgi:hypothetical protein
MRELASHHASLLVLSATSVSMTSSHLVGLADRQDPGVPATVTHISTVRVVEDQAGSTTIS